MFLKPVVMTFVSEVLGTCTAIWQNNQYAFIDSHARDSAGTVDGDCVSLVLFCNSLEVVSSVLLHQASDLSCVVYNGRPRGVDVDSTALQLNPVSKSVALELCRTLNVEFESHKEDYFQKCSWSWAPLSNCQHDWRG